MRKYTVATVSFKQHVHVGVFAALIISAGCASTQPLKTVIFDENTPVQLGSTSGIYIVAVDGTSTRSSAFQFGAGGNAAPIPPGVHVITIQASTRGPGIDFYNSSATHDFRFNFEPGHKYAVGYKNMFSDEVWLYDDTTATRFPIPKYMTPMKGVLGGLSN